MKVCRQISLLDLAYIAGIFEGEGCVSISRHLRNDTRAEGRYSYQLHVIFNMTDREPLDLLADYFGGKVRTYDYKPERNARPFHTWHISAKKAIPFLTSLQPFLRCQRIADKVELALAFQASKRYPGRFVHRPEHVAYTEERASYWAAMRRLNALGVDTPSPEERAKILAEFIPGRIVKVAP
jgi:hypothetical protein